MTLLHFLRLMEKQILIALNVAFSEKVACAYNLFKSQYCTSDSSKAVLPLWVINVVIFCQFSCMSSTVCWLILRIARRLSSVKKAVLLDFASVVIYVIQTLFFFLWGRMWNSIVSVPDHCLSIFYV